MISWDIDYCRIVLKIALTCKVSPHSTCLCSTMMEESRVHGHQSDEQDHPIIMKDLKESIKLKQYPVARRSPAAQIAKGKTDAANSGLIPLQGLQDSLRDSRVSNGILVKSGNRSPSPSFGPPTCLQYNTANSASANGQLTDTPSTRPRFPKLGPTYK